MAARNGSGTCVGGGWNGGTSRRRCVTTSFRDCIRIATGVVVPPSPSLGRRVVLSVSCSVVGDGSAHGRGETVGIFGAGAAGLTAAYFAATTSGGGNTSDGPVITLYEKTASPGAKIKASGGSRCNILPNPDAPLNIDTDFQFTSKRGALRALLASWNLHECRHWLEYDIGIPLKLEEASNKLFPQSDSGAEVRDRLTDACRRAGVRIETSANLVGVRAVGRGKFVCRFADGREVTHARVVLATGGKSFPALGTTGEGYEILKALIRETASPAVVHAPEPALTPLLFARKDDPLVSLAGVSLQNAVMSVAIAATDETKKKKKPTLRRAVRGQSLITHRGMSGPDAMDLSYYSNASTRTTEATAYRICWNREFQTPAACEEFLADALATNPKKSVRAILAAVLPTSLATFLLEETNVDPHTNISSLKKADRASLVQHLVAYPLSIDSNEGFPKAEVTSGGVPLDDLDIATMQLRDVPGLHVIGELVDVHGRIGGFNFLLAWWQGRLAGRAVAANII